MAQKDPSHNVDDASDEEVLVDISDFDPQDPSEILPAPKSWFRIGPCLP